MFNATNTWLARVARVIYDTRHRNRHHDHRGDRGDGFAAAHGWIVERRPFGVRRYRDPRFDRLPRVEHAWELAGRWSR